jgi:2-phospho-L-lactate guanylyltransferase
VRPERPLRDIAVVVPLRSFTGAKARLASVIDDDARATLAREMADRVVAAAQPHPVVVVSSAPEVVAWAHERGCAVVDDPGSLDAAATAGKEWARAGGFARVVIAHGDLPLASSLDAVTGAADDGVVVIVPDHRDDGTPVLALPVDVPFTFAYGPGSAARHATEATRIDCEVRIVRDPSLQFDVDVADDLDTLRTEASVRETGIRSSSEPWPERPGDAVAESGKACR